MNFLALDTSSVACSVAISKGDEIFSSHKVNAESHSLTLKPTIQDTLKNAKEKLNELDDSGVENKDITSHSFL